MRDDARMAVMLAKPVYKALMGEGRLDEAKTLHGQVQALIAQVGNPPKWAEDDNTAYDGSMSTGTLDIMLSLCAKACIAKDQDTAKKWLAQFNALAPESP